MTRKRIVEIMERLVAARCVPGGVAVASLMEATVLPVPLELFLMPLMQAQRQRLWRLAAAALAGCLAGALVGYLAGDLFQASAGDWIVSAAGGGPALSRAGALLRQHGFWFVLSVGVTPVPFQVAMVAAGASGYSLAGFLAATAISRSLRYFGLAALVWRFGDAAERIYRRQRRAVALGTAAVVAAGWILFGLLR